MSSRIIHRALMLLVGVLGILAVFSSAAFASGKPILTPNTASQASLNTEWVGGMLNPNGAPTSYTVEYGGTTLYGQTITPALQIPAGAEVPIEALLVGLNPMSTYHYRISATNSFGTTTTSDTMFETLLSWKVAGTRIEKLESPATYEDKYKGGASEGGKVEFRGVILGNSVRIYCKQSYASTGILGFEYANLQFANGCYTQVNGVKDASCKPLVGITLHLNGNFAQTSKTKIDLPEECTVGETVSFLSLGYGPEATSEATEKTLNMYGMGIFNAANNRGWESELTLNTLTTTGAWKLTGVNAGKVFGIS